MKRVIFFIIGIVWAMGIGHAQSKTDIRPLTIGDTVPDIPLSMYHYQDSTASMADFRGKLVVLDFWATWCSSCVAHFPTMQNLQDTYKDRLQILLVNAKNTRDTRKKVVTFFDKIRRPDGKKYTLPVVLKDTIADRIFLHKLIPHYVWIDERGVVKAITSSGEVNEREIKKMLSGDTVSFRLKKDNMHFDPHKPLFFDSLANSNRIQYGAVIGGYIEGIPTVSSWDHDSSHHIIRLSVINESILQLYRLAFKFFGPLNRMLLRVKDSAHLVPNWDNVDNWKYGDLYCYELKLPPTSKAEVYFRMRQDLKDFFGYRAEIRTETVPCFVLKNNEQIPKTLSHHAAADNLADVGIQKYMRGQPISRLVSYLDHTLALPIVDETHFTTSLDLDLPANLKDTMALRKSLRNQGFTLVRAERPLQCFILEEATSP